MNELRKLIYDEALIDILNKMFNSSSTNLYKEMEKILKGTFQANTLSSILFNIYMHSLDVYIETVLKPRYERGIKAKRCSEYRKMTALSAEEENLPRYKKIKIFNQKKRQAVIAGLTYTTLTNDFIRIKYVRHSGAFIIGVRSTKEIAKQILKDVLTFIKSTLHLEINLEKTRIIDTFSDKSHFLGMTIHNVRSERLIYRKALAIETIRRNKTRVLRRIAHLFEQREKLFRGAILKQCREAYRRNVEQGTLDLWKSRLVSEYSNVFLNTGTILKDRELYRNMAKKLASISCINENTKLKEFLKL